MTFKQLYNRVKDAKNNASDSGFYDLASHLGIVIFGLDAIYRRSLTDALMIAVNEYEELTDGITIYVEQNQHKRRGRDLVLETLREAAKKRFQKIESVFNTANYYFNDDVRNALKSLFH